MTFSGQKYFLQSEMPTPTSSQKVKTSLIISTKKRFILYVMVSVHGVQNTWTNKMTLMTKM
jgi:hypothetical protein